MALDLSINSASPTDTLPRLVVRGVTKAFPGVVALDNVSFDVLPGEIHALAGENGAGKSTLMHVIAGVYQPDTGSMEIDGHPYAPADEKAAQQAGVAIVFQEGSLFPPLSVAENIFAGRQPVKGISVDFTAMRRTTQALLEDLGVQIDPATPVAHLSPGQRQLVEIAKALSQQVRILILDEPTSSLTISEARQLFTVLRQLAGRGVAIVFVTHRLGEIFELADRVTVLKDGKVTGVRAIRQTHPDEIIHLEVGRELSFARDPQQIAPDAPVVLSVEGLVASPVKEASLEVRAGEIVCLAGLVGAGRTELCEAIFGIRPRQAGIIRINGVPIEPKHPLDAMNAQIGMVPEDRRDDGLFLAMSITDNIAAANMHRVSRAGLMDSKAAADLANQSAQMLRIATPNVEREVMFLSGGNQQKVLLAKWLARKPRLLIVDEPTRGVDVGAKSDLYTILRELARNQVALLVVSSDLPEVLALAHRIVVMSEGRTVGEIDAAEANEVKILQMATPGNHVSQRVETTHG
ncbi:MAG TPA: sugar ABC transporter ATP-binding protein [Anaerolineaceae bacterium]|nr:sugar ABC transporter ATP-binding protein [Anaerolineaceae bacterium]